MEKLVLSKSENQELLEKGSVEIEKNGFPIHIEKMIISMKQKKNLGLIENTTLQ